MWKRVCNVCVCPGRIGSASCVQTLNSVVTGSMRWPGRTTGSGPIGASPDSSFARAALSRSASRFDGGFAARASSCSLMRKSGRSAFSRSHSSFFEYSRSSGGARCSAARRDRIEDPRRRFGREPVGGQREARGYECGRPRRNYNAGSKVPRETR